MSLLETRPVAMIELEQYASKSGLEKFAEVQLSVHDPDSRRRIANRLWTVFTTRPSHLHAYYSGLDFVVRCGKCHFQPEETCRCNRLAALGPYSDANIKRYTLVEKRSVIDAVRKLKRLRDRNLNKWSQGHKLRAIGPSQYELLIAWVGQGFPGDDPEIERYPIPLCGSKTQDASASHG